MDQASRPEAPTRSGSGTPLLNVLNLEKADRVPLRRVRKLVRLLLRPAYRPGLRRRVAAGVEHESVAFGHDFVTVIDVGAHNGQFALFASWRFPRAKLVCLEPLSAARAKLSQVLANHHDLTIVGVAASGNDGMRRFRVSRSTASSSLLEMTATMPLVFPGTEQGAVIEVPTARLDATFPEAPRRPCLLKVDVQGAELEVLKGAERLLEQVDEIYVECSFVEFYREQPLIDDVIVHLAARGFRLRGIHSLVRDTHGRCLQADVLFARR